jgi:glycosyltransferase involved in cell wall biosynthesis
VPTVSVIVPVYNPGEKLSECVKSLLGQSLPADEIELIFVDDGSTDESPARLDRLAAEHANVRVEHMPNSGWPGRPRNRGLELATGEFVYFVDNDDWLDPLALERLHEMAVLDDADIVIGKVVGHGKASARLLFRENLHGIRFEDKPGLLLKLLTPHKLFRRALIEEHGLRFPEGKRRLEDHAFVVGAYFRAQRISVLADHPCYHWVFHDAAENASHQRIGEDYFEAVREVLDLVDRNTEPGDLRERLALHWYRSKMLNRVGGRGLVRRDPEQRRAQHESIRRLALERWGDDVHERLPFHLRIRSRLLRDGSLDQLVALARMESGLAPRIALRKVQVPGTHALLKLDARLGADSPLLAFYRDGDRVVWDAPEELRGALRPEDLDVTAALRSSTVSAYLERLEDGLQYALPVTTKLALADDAESGRVVPVVTATTIVSPTIAGGGAPLPAGRWAVHATVSVAGFSATRRLSRAGRELVLTTVPPGRIAEGEEALRPSLKRRVRAAAPWLARALSRTRAARAAAARG